MIHCGHLIWEIYVEKKGTTMQYLWCGSFITHICELYLSIIELMSIREKKKTVFKKVTLLCKSRLIVIALYTIHCK